MKKLLSIVTALLTFAIHSAAQEAPAGEKQEEKPIRLRILCPTALSEDHTLTLASKKEDGSWLHLDEVTLRSPYISQWLSAKQGPLFLGTPSGDDFTINCKFEYPASANDVVVVLLADPSTGKYRPDVINPAKLKFSKGSSLLVNYSTLDSAVILGENKYRIKPGARLITKPIPEENGMYRMVMGHTTPDNKITAFYDRAQTYNDQAREFVLLFPDPARNSIRVFIIPEFNSL